MRTLLSTIIAIMACAISVWGQNRTSLLQRINEIKSQSDVYYWDQYTCPDADTAKYNATKRLLLDVNDNLSENQKFTVEEIMPYASYVNIDRGNLKQFFVYMKKTDAMALKSGRTGQPVVGVPVNTQGGAPVVANNTPVVVGVPIDTNPAGRPGTSPVQRNFVPDAFVQRIMETKDFKQVYSYLKSQQTDGQILQFGSLKEVDDYSSLDLILFDIQSQQVVTMLSGTTAAGNRVNMVNGGEDSLSNYPTSMTAVIWYIKK